jgi:hypothetical protein
MEIYPFMHAILKDNLPLSFNIGHEITFKDYIVNSSWR